MIMTLLLICQVGGEWVQISQQHYRKPYRPTQYFPGPDKVTEIYEEDITSKDNQIYFNQSLPDHIWKEADKIYPTGTIIRVQTNNEHVIKSAVHRNINKLTSATPFIKHRNYNSNENDAGQKFGFIIGEDEDDVSDLYNFKFSPSANEEYDEKHLLSSEETTTKVNNYPYNHENLNHFNRFETHKYKHYRPSVNESEQSEDEFEVSYPVFPKVESVKRVQLDSRTVRTSIIKQIRKNEHIPTLDIEGNKRTNITNKTLIEATDKNKIVTSALNNTEKQVKKTMKVNSTKKLHNQMGNDFNTEYPNHGNIKQTLEFNQLKNVNGETPFFVTKDEFVDHLDATLINETTSIVHEDNSESNMKGTSNVVSSTANDPKGHYKDRVEDTLTNANKMNTMGNLVKLMKTVADTISRNTRRSVNSKVRYLRNLQDTILTNIKQRIDTVWPDDVVADDTARRRRAARAAEDTARGHVEFPSSESTLMTISFLTFAVYLIKLILQVIHAYKNKAVMMSPAFVTAVGRKAASVHRHSTNSN